jgi:hypothetical protein
MAETQCVNVKLAGHYEAIDYAKDLERRGYNVKLTPSLEGSNWFWTIEADKAIQPTPLNPAIVTAINDAEKALGENLVWITDQLDLQIRQKDAETINRLTQLQAAWQKLCLAKAAVGA